MTARKSTNASHRLGGPRPRLQPNTKQCGDLAIAAPSMRYESLDQQPTLYYGINT